MLEVGGQLVTVIFFFPSFTWVPGTEFGTLGFVYCLSHLADLGFPWIISVPQTPHHPEQKSDLAESIFFGKNNVS